MKKHSFSPRKSQRGIVLVVAMVMLVIMSILAISSIRNISLEERMSASMHDRSIALQAAEAAILAGQRDVRNRIDMAGFNPDAPLFNGPQAAVNGFIAQPTTQPPDWMMNQTWNNVNSRQLNVNLGALAGNKPRYLIEYRGKTVCKPPLVLRSNGTPALPDRNDCNTPEGPASPTCNCYLFRITARSNPGANRAEVVLQSLYTTF